MYVTKKFEEVLDNNKYKNYKLCYIDYIPTTIYDWDEESKLILQDPNFSWNNLYFTRRLRQKEYNNPEYVEGLYEELAYFTPLDLNDQWGDDWNDAPYEHNAGTPYDSRNKISDNEIEILQIPFYLPSDSVFYFPKDRGFGGNSPFSVKDINMGAIPWIFYGDSTNNKYDSISSGTTPDEFIEKISEWMKYK